MPRKFYCGARRESGCAVLAIEDGERRPLEPRLDLCNHSPTGFEWGYGGSGPAQLALALLCDVFGDEKALDLYQDFKFEVVASWRETWRIAEAEIRAWDARRHRLGDSGTILVTESEEVSR